ncbi:hypothetical protein Droror1_Dr00007816 [Drosera rotundifolia]
MPAEVKVEWYRLIWNKDVQSKHEFVVWLLVLHDRLKTRNKLYSWGLINKGVCPLCRRHEENKNHLFTESEYALEAWRMVLQFAKIKKVWMTWTEMIPWLCRLSKSKNQSIRHKKQIDIRNMVC